jgi:hypothetical protein
MLNSLHSKATKYRKAKIFLKLTTRKNAKSSQF